MTIKKQRVLFIIIGLVITILLLETSLRLAGFIYKTYRINKKIITKEDKNTVKILCLGDSFTFGQGAPKGYSYPEQLEKMLNEDKSNHKFIIYNGGIPGYNSSQLSRHIEEFIQKYDPSILIIMIGLNNKDCIQESNYFLFKSGIKAQIYRMDSLLSCMRSYKLLKLGLGKLRQKIWSWRKPATKIVLLSDDSELLSLEENKELGQVITNEEIYDKDIKLHLNVGGEYLNKGEVKLAIEEFKKAATLDPYDERGYLKLAHIYIHCTHQYELAIEMLKKALRINPKDLTALESLWMAYYRIGKNELAAKALKKYLYLKQDYDSGLSDFLLTGLPSINDEEAFERLLRYDLENIVNLIQSKGLKIILQGYLFRSPNEYYIIEEIADKYKIPFVDNLLIFDKLKLSEGYRDRDYFIEDWHPNANGYRIIAENVYNVLQAMGLLK